MRTVVVLPAPLGPRKPKSSPRETSRSIPRTASIPPLKVRLRPLASTAALPAAGASATVSVAVDSIRASLVGCLDRLPVGCPAEGGDVELAHLQHGLHRPLRPSGIRA